MDGERAFRLGTSDQTVDWPTWEDVRRAIDDLGSGRGEFVVLEQMQLSSEIAYIQVMEDNGSHRNGSYRVEAQRIDSDDSTGLPQYSCNVASRGAVIEIFRNWMVEGQAPDVRTWDDISKTPVVVDAKTERLNRVILVVFLIVAAVIILGGLAYIVGALLA
jgi:hypothetical protein